MARSAASGSGALFEAFRQVGPQGREGRRKAAQRAGCKSEKQSEGDDASVHGDGVDARHGLRQKMQRGADGDRGKRQTQQAAGQAEQQAFEDGFADDGAGTRAQSQANGVFAAPADGPDQQQPGDIDAGNQQNDGDGEEQGAQQGTDVGDGILDAAADITPDVNRRHAGGKIAHDLLGDAVGILRGLREGDAILEAGDHVVSPKAGVLVGEFIRREAHGHPELRLVEVPGLQRKLEAARHDADDRVRSCGRDRWMLPRTCGIAVVAVQPQGVADARRAADAHPLPAAVKTRPRMG